MFGYRPYVARYATCVLLVFASLSSLMSSLNNVSSLSNQKRDEDVEQIIGTLDEQSKALQNIQGTLDSGFGSATKHRNENKEEVKTHVTEQLEIFRQEMIERQAETERKRDREHQESLALMKTAMTGGKTLNFESNDAPAATGDYHLGKDIVVADEETTTTTEQSSNSSTALKSIAADESLPDAAKEETADLKDTVDVNLKDMDANVEKSAPLANTKSTTVDLSLPADKDEVIDFKNTVEVKVEKESLASTAPHTPGPRNSTTRAKTDRPPSGLKRRLAAATPHSKTTRLSEAETEHIERRKRGRVKETANSEAKTMNVKHEQIFQTRRQTRSASKKQPPSGSR